MKYITPKTNKSTLIDDEDYERIKALGFGIHIATNSYVYIRMPLHRFIMNNPEGLVIDHINGDPTDNRKENLRAVTQQVNTLNNTKAKYYGWDSRAKKYQVRIKGTNKHFGFYDTPEEAEAAVRRMLSGGEREIAGERLDNKIYPNVQMSGSKYQPRVSINGKRTSLGVYETLDEAIEALSKHRGE